MKKVFTRYFILLISVILVESFISQGLQAQSVLNVKVLGSGNSYACLPAYPKTGKTIVFYVQNLPAGSGQCAWIAPPTWKQVSKTGAKFDTVSFIFIPDSLPKGGELFVSFDNGNYEGLIRYNVVNKAKEYTATIIADQPLACLGNNLKYSIYPPDDSNYNTFRTNPLEEDEAGILKYYWTYDNENYIGWTMEPYIETTLDAPISKINVATYTCEPSQSMVPATRKFPLDVNYIDNPPYGSSSVKPQIQKISYDGLSNSWLVDNTLPVCIQYENLPARVGKVSSNSDGFLRVQMDVPSTPHGDSLKKYLVYMWMYDSTQIVKVSDSMSRVNSLYNTGGFKSFKYGDSAYRAVFRILEKDTSKVVTLKAFAYCPDCISNNDFFSTDTATITFKVIDTVVLDGFEFRVNGPSNVCELQTNIRYTSTILNRGNNTNITNYVWTADPFLISPQTAITGNNYFEFTADTIRNPNLVSNTLRLFTLPSTQCFYKRFIIGDTVGIVLTPVTIRRIPGTPVLKDLFGKTYNQGDTLNICASTSFIETLSLQQPFDSLSSNYFTITEGTVHNTVIVPPGVIKIPGSANSATFQIRSDGSLFGSIGELSISSQNICGTSTVPLVIETRTIDTIANDTIVDKLGNDILDFSTVFRLCKDSITTYSLKHTNNFVTEYVWNMPAGWAQPSVPPYSTMFIKIGATSNKIDTISLQSKNKCGLSKKSIILLDPIYPRGPIAWTQTYDDTVCQNQTITYSFKVVKDADRYTLRFPLGWEIHSLVTTSNAGTFTTTDYDVFDTVTKLFNFIVTAKTSGADSVVITCTNNDCGKTYSESLKTFSRSNLPAPTKAGIWPTSVCQILPTTTPIVKLYVNTSSFPVGTPYTLKWGLPSGCTQAQYYGNGDSIRIITSGIFDDTVKVFGVINRCANNDVVGGDTLRVRLIGRDTISSNSIIFEDWSGNPFNNLVCANVPFQIEAITPPGVDKFIWSYPGQGMAAINKWTISPNDSSSRVQFTIDSSENKFIGVRASNVCGTSKVVKYTDTIQPMYIKLFERLQPWKSAICAGSSSERKYSFKALPYITSYNVSFPSDWTFKDEATNVKSFTNSDALGDSISFVVIPGTDTGFLLIETELSICNTKQIDSTKLQKISAPHKPVLVSTSTPKACAADTITFIAKINTLDAGITNLSFRWIYDQTIFTRVRENIIGDTRYLTLRTNRPLPSNKNTIISAYTWRDDCDDIVYSQDSLHVNVYLMDTVSLALHRLISADPLIDLSKDPCYEDILYIADSGNNQDIEKYKWSYPNDWSYINTDTASPIRLKTGSDEGYISVQAQNKCGLSTPLAYPRLIKPISIKNFKKIEQNWNPAMCPDAKETRTYIFKILPFGDSYDVKFPNDWVIQSTGTSLAHFTNSNAGSDSLIRFEVETGFDTGYIVVNILNIFCNSSERDSTKIYTWRNAKQPVPVGSWPTKLCIGSTVDLMVTADSADYGAPLFYEWLLPAQFAATAPPRPASDTTFKQISFKVNAVLNPGDRFGVVAKRKDCGNTWKYSTDTLWYNFITLDTAVIPSVITLLDNGAIADLTPCEGTSVNYSVDMSGIDPNYIDHFLIKWNDIDTVPAGDTLKGQWTFTNKSSLPNHLEMTVGKAPLTLTFQPENYCGISKATASIVVNPSVRPGAISWVDSSSNLCEQSTGIFFSVDTIQGASFYAWEFPSDWTAPNGSYMDTSHNSTTSKVSGISVKTGSISGLVSVIAQIGHCFTTSSSLPFSLNPAPLPPVYDGIWHDTTICKSSNLTLKVKPNPSETNPNVSFRWLFPGNDWTITSSNTDSSEITVTTGSRKYTKDSIRVLTNSDECSSSEGGMLKLPITIWGQEYLALPDSAFFDAILAQPLDLIPCETSSVKYYINRQFIDPSIDSLKWIIGNSDTLPNNGILDNGWTVNDASSFPDYLDLIVGTDSFLLKAYAKNKCGTGNTKDIIIRPGTPIAGKTTITSDVSTYCFNDTVTLTAALSSGTASKYIWHYPWKSKADTTTSKTLSLKIGSASGKIWVVPTNGCGSGLLFDSLDVLPLLNPHKPYYVKEDGVVTRGINSITDTFCKNGKHIVFALKNDADMGNVTFVWTSYTNPPGQIPVGRVVQRGDSLITNNLNGLAVTQFRATVYPKYAECKNPAIDSVIDVWITLVDTVPMSSLGRIVDISGANIKKQPCPGDTMHVKVEHNVARAYRWFLPNNSWRFVNTDTAHASVKIIVGTSSGEISVISRTSNDNKYCGADYGNTISLKSGTIRPNRAWNIIDWPGLPNSVCEGQTLTVNVLSDARDEDNLSEQNPASLIDGFKWIFPKGWTVTSSDAVKLNDSVYKTPHGTCNVTIGKISGNIKSSVITKCDTGIDGSWSVKPIATTLKAHVTLSGEMHPCADSNITLNIQKTNPEDVFTLNYYTNSSVSPYQPTFNSDSSKVSFPALSLGDSLIISVEAVNSCGIGVTEIYIIKADTIPTIIGHIDGWGNPCDLTTHGYKAIVTNADYHVKFEWVVPRIWNETIVNDSMVNIYFRSFGNTVIDSILAYPVTACGSGVPFVLPITVSVPEDFDASLKITNITKPGNTTNPCEENILRINITENGSIIPITSVDSFQWEIPAGWTFISDSTKAEVDIMVGTTNGTISVQRLIAGHCGFSKAILHPSPVITPKLLPAKTEFTRSPYPCINETDVKFEVANDPNTESMTFQVDPSVSAIINTVNRPYYVEIEDVGVVPFNIFVESSNGCGSRSINYTVSPVAPLSTFTGTIKHERFCALDTVKVFVDITNDYIVNHAVFNWEYPVNWKVVKEETSSSDNTNGIYIIPSKEDEGLISITPSNACGTPDNYASPIDAKPVVLTVEAAAIPDNTNFKESVILQINNVERTPTPFTDSSDFDFVWNPADKINGTNTGYADKTTKELLHPVETFVLTVTESVVTPEMLSEEGQRFCKTSATVPVIVNGALEAAIIGRSHICEGSDAILTATTSGGDTSANASFAYQWYIFDTLNQKYYPLGENGEITINNKDLNDSNLIMMIAANSFFIADYGDVEIYDTTHFNLVLGDSIFAKIESPFYKNVTVKIGEKIYFRTTVKGGYGSDLLWLPEDLFEEGENTGLNPQTKMLLAPNIIHVFATDTVSGCMSQDSIIIKTNYDFGTIPNAFTPNGDGINDIFMPGVDLEIYSRWEQLLFKSGSKEGWDGKVNGKVVKNGEYLYIIKVKDDSGVVHTKSGFVTVLE